MKKKYVGLIKFVETLAVVVIWPSLKQKRKTDAKEFCMLLEVVRQRTHVVGTRNR
jgi:hypothetical protein